MSGQKWPSHSGNEAVDNTAFSSNTHVWKVKRGMDGYTPGPAIRKGMDGYTASLILEVAKEDIGAWADLYKAMNQKHTPKNDVERAHVVYEQLWYKVWATVEDPTSHILGFITGLNTNTGGFYPWDRYPIYMQNARGNFEYSIFPTAYSSVKEYIHNPKKILKDRANDLAWKVVPDTVLSTEQRQQYIEKQSELTQYNFVQQKEYFEHTKRSDLKKNDKLYIYDYLAYRFKNDSLFSNSSEDNIDEYTQIILNRKIVDEELFTCIEERYLKLLQMNSENNWFLKRCVEDNHVKVLRKNDIAFSVKTSQILGIYKKLDTLGKEYIDLKNKIWQILQERIDVIQWDQLYDFVAEVAWTPFEKIAFDKLESAL